MTQSIDRYVAAPVHEVIDAIESEIGKIARSKNVWIASGMPKTRSGKITRQVIAAPPPSRISATPRHCPTPRSSTAYATTCRARRSPAGDILRELSSQERAEIEAFGGDE
jgi:hypothetical protein